MKKTMFLALILAAVMLFGACGTLTEIDKIDTEAAKAIALKALNLTGEEVSYAEAVLNERDGRKYYDVKITVDGIDYAFAVDAISGVVIQPNNIAEMTYIGQDKAFEASYTDAGYTAEQSTLVFWELHENNGTASYELWFYGADQGYHYQVDAVTGEILTGTETEITIPGRNNAVDESAMEVIQPPIGGDTVIDLTPAEVGFPKRDLVKSSKYLGEMINSTTVWKTLRTHSGYSRTDMKILAFFIEGKGATYKWHTYFSTPDGKFFHYILNAQDTADPEQAEILGFESASSLAELSHPLRDSNSEVVLPDGSVSIKEAYGYALKMFRPTEKGYILYVAEPDLCNGEYEYDFIFQNKETSMFCLVSVRASDGAIRHWNSNRWMKCEFFGAMFEDISSVKLTEYAAKKAALSYVPGAATTDITAFTTDTADGKMEYEGTITYGGMNYTFEIDAYSGAFRSWNVTPAA